MEIKLKRLDLPKHISSQLKGTNLDKLEGNWWENIFGIGPHWGRIINAKIAHERKKVYSEEEENCRTCIRFSCTQKKSQRQGCSEKVYPTPTCDTCGSATCEGSFPCNDWKRADCTNCGFSDCNQEKKSGIMQHGLDCPDWVKPIVFNYKIDIMPDTSDFTAKIESMAKEIGEAAGEKKSISIDEYIETLQEIKHLVAKVGLTGRVTLHENQ